jgi:hypothetical protein
MAVMAFPTGISDGFDPYCEEENGLWSTRWKQYNRCGTNGEHHQQVKSPAALTRKGLAER